MFKSKKTKFLFRLSIFITSFNQPLQSDINDYFPYNVGPSASNYGNTGIIERSASDPCPISLRPGERIGRVSPTEKGGKL